MSGSTLLFIAAAGIVLALVSWALEALIHWWVTPAETASVSSASSKDEAQDVEHIKTYRWLYWLTLILLAIAFGAAAWLAIDSTFTILSLSFNFGYLIAVVGLLYFIDGFDIIKRNEIAGVSVLGVPTTTFSGSFMIAPRGIFQQDEVTGLVIELAWPEDPAKVWHGDPKIEVPDGYFLPIRVPFADPPPGEEDNDPLNRRTTNEVSLYVRIRVDNFFDFYARIGDTTDSNVPNHDHQVLENARTQIGNMAISLINREFAKMTPAKALASLEDVNDKLLALIKEKTKWWGIDVVTAQVKLIELSKSLNSSIEKAAEGKADARGAVSRAEGEKVKRTLEGEGTANATRADINARTDGLQRMAKELGIPVESILAAQAIRDIAQGNNEKIIMPGFEGFAKVIDSVANGFKRQGSTPPAGGTT